MSGICAVLGPDADSRRVGMKTKEEIQIVSLFPLDYVSF
jgi:hypothetical protein